MKPFEKFLTMVFVMLGLAAYGFAAKAQMQPAPIDVSCPSEEPCQVLVLTATEIKLLVGDNAILATAAQARNLDLGQYVAYFRQKIALAPAGKRTAVTDLGGKTGGVTGDSPGHGSFTNKEPPGPSAVEPKK